MNSDAHKDITMIADEAFRARRAAGIKTLAERMREDPERARRMDNILAQLRLEQQFFEAMEELGVSAAELARRTKRKPAAISRDLAGGFSAAKLGRLREMADAIGYDVVPLLLPRDRNERRSKLKRIVKELT